ncbi:hypothetical protein AGROH133_14158 (plasmid) [Agrobacterium tumefaciens]|nr:hypothetical protein AGROH133_14158 [Agrobacterium tumefaciens]
MSADKVLETRLWLRISSSLEEAQIPDHQLSRPLKFAQLPASAVYDARYRKPCQLTRFAVLHQLQRSTVIPTPGQGAGGRGQGAGGRGQGAGGRLISCKTVTVTPTTYTKRQYPLEQGRDVDNRHS